MSTAPNAPALADRQAITDMIYRYCRAVDRLDISLGHSIWHVDGVADYGNFYQGDGRGVIDLICAQHEQLLHHSHQVSNILIEIDGDCAGSEAYVTATLRCIRDARVMQIDVWGRYVDWWSRREGCWGLDKRIAILDFDEIRDVVEMQRHKAGRRDRRDASYAALERGLGGGDAIAF
jgi:hypothetical protein